MTSFLFAVKQAHSLKVIFALCAIISAGVAAAGLEPLAGSTRAEVTRAQLLL